LTIGLKTDRLHYGSILEPEIEKNMSALTIKNIPEKLRKRLKESAEKHHRSINSEAIVCLEKVLAVDRLDPKEFLEQARALRERSPQIFITEEFLRAAKGEGRP
jgi:antitoxin FitA